MFNADGRILALAQTRPGSNIAKQHSWTPSETWR